MIATTGLFRTIQVLLLTTTLVIGSAAAAQAVGLNLNQCANGSLANLAVACGTNPPTWQNGNLNRSNAQYREGDGLPYRNAITGLTNGTWSVMLDYDFTKAGISALDRLTLFNLTQASDPCLSTSDVTCTVGSPAFTFTIPSEVASPDATHPALPNSGDLAIASPPGGTVDTAAKRSMTVWVQGGTGTFGTTGSNCTGTQATSLNNGFVVQNGLASGDSDRQFGFKFTLGGCPAGGCNVMLGWTGHIASATDWGAGKGASSISGAPFHMRLQGTDQVCGTSGGNQDRSVQLSALAAPTQGTLTVIKHVIGGPNVAGDFTMTVKQGATTITSFPGAESPGSSVNLAPNTYTVTESSVDAYTSDFSACGSNGTVTVTAGQTTTCTVTNTAPESPTVLTVIKHVVGGTASADNFTMTIKQGATTIASFPGAESPGIATTVTPGTFAVTESSVTGYSASFSGDCDSSGNVTVNMGETKTCTVTNTFTLSAPIPTLSEWAQLAMVAVLVVGGLLALRRRRSPSTALVP